MNEQELRENVIRLCNAGNKIEAIKLYREKTGKGLADSKHDVEALARGEALSVPLAQMAPLGEGQDTVESYIRAGQKINAIKLYREATGLGLAEAKIAVESMEAAMKRGEPPTALRPQAPPAMQPPAMQPPPRSTAFGASPHVERTRKPFGEELPSMQSESSAGLILLLGLLLFAGAAAFAGFLFLG